MVFVKYLILNVKLWWNMPNIWCRAFNHLLAAHINWCLAWNIDTKRKTLDLEHQNYSQNLTFWFKCRKKGCFDHLELLVTSNELVCYHLMSAAILKKKSGWIFRNACDLPELELKSLVCWWWLRRPRLRPTTPWSAGRRWSRWRFWCTTLNIRLFCAL